VRVPRKVIISEKVQDEHSIHEKHEGGEKSRIEGLNRYWQNGNPSREKKKERGEKKKEAWVSSVGKGKK